MLGNQFDARGAYDTQLADAMSHYVNMNSLKLLMDSADDSKNTNAQKDLADFPAKYPLQSKQIQAYINAHRALMTLSGGGIDDPAELQRLITKAGVLDFRITVTANELGGELSSEYQSALHSLSEKGPDQPISVGGVRAPLVSGRSQR